MSGILDKVNSPKDLKDLSAKELSDLAEDVRQLVIETVGRNGGHLGANLGVCELTVALLKVFDPPADKVVFDTSHQVYPYKILTERKDRFHTIRQPDGLSGFAKRAESEYDAFGAGHAGTAISAALGMAAARDQRGSDEHVIALVGDAAVSNGTSMEALNNVVDSTKRLIVILNDNDMSIDENVGAMSKYLGRLLSNPHYNHLKEAFEKTVKHALPSKKVSEVYHKLEEATKGLFLRSMIFEEFGLRYIGPVDGHDIQACMDALQIAKESSEPILVHMVTVKGKGYKLAEEDQMKWHGPSPFHPESGKPITTGASAGPKWSNVFGDSLCRIAEKDPRVVAIAAGTRTGCGLAGFNETFPERTYDVGICENHAVVFACGLACEDVRPVFAVYSTFSQRSVDNVIHDMCLQNLPVIITHDRAGFVGDDGPTHHGTFDIALLRPVPNLIIMQPRNEAELANMLYSAFKWERPVVMRYPRGSAPGVPLPETFSLMEPGKAEVLQEGDDIQLWALGDMVPLAEETAAELSRRGFLAGVVDARFAKPLDTDLLDAQSRARVIATIENGVVIGGFGSGVEAYMAEKGYATRVRKFGWPDEFITHGKTDPMYEQYGLTPSQIASEIESSLPVTF